MVIILVGTFPIHVRQYTGHQPKITHSDVVTQMMMDHDKSSQWADTDSDGFGDHQWEGDACPNDVGNSSSTDMDAWILMETELQTRNSLTIQPKPRIEMVGYGDNHESVKLMNFHLIQLTGDNPNGNLADRF